MINNPKFIERAEIILNKGTNRSAFLNGQADKYTWVDIGSSYCPSEITAAFLYAQLELAEKITAKRSRMLDYYFELLDPIRERLPSVKGNGHIMYIMCDSAEQRLEMIDTLKKVGIMSAWHYVPLHQSPMAGRCRVHGTMKVTEMAGDCLLRLPLYYEITPHDIARVAEEILRFYV